MQGMENNLACSQGIRPYAVVCIHVAFRYELLRVLVLTIDIMLKKALFDNCCWTDPVFLIQVSDVVTPEMKVTPHVVFKCCTEPILGAEPRHIMRRREPVEASLHIFAINVTSYVTLSWCGERQVDFYPRKQAVTVAILVSDDIHYYKFG